MKHTGSRIVSSADFPRANIGTFPTPVETVPEFGTALGVPNLSLKREDRAGTSYGGNKVRKLEYLLGDALDSGCERVFTSGGVGSHHVLATATYARAVGLEPRALQFPQSPTEHVRENLCALAGLEPTLQLVPSEYLLPVSLARTRLQTRFDERCYHIPTGGSSPRGTLGFVDAAAELEQQVCRGELPEPDVIVLPASSGGTLAGLRVGLDRTTLGSRLVGVRVVPWFVTNRLTLARLATQTARLLSGSGRERYRRADFELLTDFLGDGYAEPTAGGQRVSRLAESFGITLDPTYTAKTVWAISETFDEERVLYWHTLSASTPEQLPVEQARKRLPDGYERFLSV